nr:SH3 domain-containing protein [uncultured Sphingomonas sp.]
MKRAVIFASLLALPTTASAQEERKLPYWASIASGEAMSRTGPGRNYPGVWLYKRRDLPVKVIQTYQSWRKIEDPDGEQGWMLVTLMSGTRTGMVKPGEPRDIRTKAAANAPVRYRAQAGVVGRIDHCDGQWCHIQLGPREGYISQSDLYGTELSEIIE